MHRVRMDDEMDDADDDYASSDGSGAGSPVPWVDHDGDDHDTESDSDHLSDVFAETLSLGAVAPDSPSQTPYVHPSRWDFTGSLRGHPLHMAP